MIRTSLTNLSVRKKKTTVRNLRISSVRPKEVSKIQEEMAPRKRWEKTPLAKTCNKINTITASQITAGVFILISAKKLTRHKSKLKIIPAPKVVAVLTRWDLLKFITKLVNYWRIGLFLASRRGKFLLFLTRWINRTKTSSDFCFIIMNRTNTHPWAGLVGGFRRILGKSW